MDVVEVEAVPVVESKMYSVAKRDGDAPPGSRAASRRKGQHRDPGDPVGTIGVVADGGVSARDNRSTAPSRDRKSDSLILPDLDGLNVRLGRGTALLWGGSGPHRASYPRGYQAQSAALGLLEGEQGLAAASLVIYSAGNQRLCK